MADRMWNIRQSAMNNSTDLQEFLKDLNDWEGDIKQKDDKLKSGPKETTDDLPPIRGASRKKKGDEAKKGGGEEVTGQSPPVSAPSLENGVPTKKRKPTPRDFRAWDKMDVDRMLKELDEEDVKLKVEAAESDSSEEEEESDAAAKLRKRAAFEKDRGNEYFRKGDYNNAVECYGRGIGADPRNAVLFANRAMALLKQEKYGAAEADCDVALDIDPAYVKALLRRGAARMSLGKLDDAETDFEDVLFLEGNNKQAKQELAKVKKLIDKRGFEKKEKEKSAKPEKQVRFSEKSTIEKDKVDPKKEEKKMDGRVYPIEKPAEKRSKNPLRRIPIQEVGLSAEEMASKSSAERMRQKRLNQMSETDLKFFKGLGEEEEEREIELEVREKPMKPAMIQVLGKSEKKPTKKEAKLKEDGGKAKIQLLKTKDVKVNGSGDDDGEENPLQSVRINRPTNKEDYWQSVAEDLDPERKTRKGSKADSPRSTEKTATTADIGDSFSRLAIASVDVPSPPKTALQLQTDLNRLRNASTSSALKYLLAIAPESLPGVIGNMLDTDLLMSVVRIFDDTVDEYDVDTSSYLLSLSKTNRFDMAAMFMTQKDKETVNRLVRRLTEKGLIESKTSGVVSKKYGIV